MKNITNSFNPVEPKRSTKKPKKASDVSKKAQAFADTDRFSISFVYLGETVTQKWDQ